MPRRLDWRSLWKECRASAVKLNSLGRFGWIERIPLKFAHAKSKQGVLKVRIRSFVFSLVAAVALTSAANAQQQPAAAGAAAQPAAQARPNVPVAVIDLAYILNNHPTMKGQIEAIKAESEQVGQQFEARRKDILKKMDQMRETLTEGTAEYQKMEQQIAAEDTSFRLDVVRKNKEFDEKRAQIFATVHAQVTEQVKLYCDYANTYVVLKVAREKPDAKKPSTIETAMMQEVFYHNPAPNVDITDWVIGRLQASAASAAGGAGTAPTQSATRPTPGQPRTK